ncbi:PAS domain S-box protein [Pseudaminobacter soli (ex Li et al. 2025)]|uniref:Blue-light-activated histidine kinase n=1 Tax=Pseudaminobacter soli (ex Li et al. 2025) TaxID=1295366 RepID=A0A2P7S1E5_9HYPH|nr:PAS domain S-box protein [Mesorhizobium soli]PSJ56272.1 histidine kinase [Mesorhizobium soli]
MVHSSEKQVQPDFCGSRTLGDGDAPDPRDWLAAIIEGSDDAIVSKDLKGTIQSWNPGASRLFGYTANEVVGKPITILIPQDRLDEEPAILSQIQQGKRVEHFETVRRRKDGSLVDISLTISPIRNGQGVIVGASKIARDITEKRLAREQQQLFMGELRHRVKNLFALASAIVSVSARSCADTEELVGSIQARLSSLAHAHELTMSGWQDELETEQQVDLEALIRTILEPYSSWNRTAVEGDNPVVRGKCVTHIALLLHELATNAAKYGSLSADNGKLRVNVQAEGDQVRLLWEETGGPVPSPGPVGFGSRLEKGLASALSATIERDWRTTGLVATITIPTGILNK